MTMMVYEPFDVVEVPFPFSDSPRSKLRKALVLSSKEHNRENGATTLIMITSARYSKWRGDVELSNWQEAGLRKPCFTRLKFFTADNEILKGKVGHLSKKDQVAIRHSVTELFSL